MQDDPAFFTFFQFAFIFACSGQEFVKVAFLILQCTPRFERLELSLQLLHLDIGHIVLLGFFLTLLLAKHILELGLLYMMEEAIDVHSVERKLLLKLCIPV